jgi:hypothetical protein
MRWQRVCQDAHSLHLVGDLLHLDKDLLEWQTHTNQMEACFLLTSMRKGIKIQET